MNRPADVLCLSSIDWDFIWQGHQEIMSRLAADGHRVLFVENTGVRGPALGDFPRVRKRVLSWWKATKGFREERPNLFVYSPLVFPFPYSRFARLANRFLLMRSLSAAVVQSAGPTRAGGSATLERSTISISSPHGVRK